MSGVGKIGWKVVGIGSGVVANKVARAAIEKAWVKANLDKIIWAALLIPGLMVLFGAWRARRITAMRTAAQPARRV